MLDGGRAWLTKREALATGEAAAAVVRLSAPWVRIPPSPIDVLAGSQVAGFSGNLGTTVAQREAAAGDSILIADIQGDRYISPADISAGRLSAFWLK